MSEIVVPLDGSRFSERALEFASALADALHGRLNLIHVIEPPAVARARRGWLEGEHVEAHKYLEGVRGTLGELVATTTVRGGQAAAEIVRFADELPAELIVMATRGRGGFGRLMLGSVADKVVRGARVPVGLIRPDDGEPSRPIRLARLLLPLDGSECAERALPLALSLARQSGASIHLVRVIEPVWTKMIAADPTEMTYLSSEMIAEIEEALRVDARDYLSRVAERVRIAGVAVTWEAPAGRPATQIVRVADAEHADAIVLSTHGRGGIARVALGSVTQEVVYTSHTPLLVVPPEPAAPRG